MLDAAAQAFAAKGFPAVTILDVAEITGMTKGAVYFHYSNKEALAIAVAVLASAMNDQVASNATCTTTNATPNGMNSACGVRSWLISCRS